MMVVGRPALAPSQPWALCRGQFGPSSNPEETCAVTQIWMEHMKRSRGVSAKRIKKKQALPLSSRRETILYPLLLPASPEDEPKLTDGQFADLEKAGRISLTSEARRYLNNIAISWAARDRARHSPRPREFRARLRSIRSNLEKAHAEADLNREGATPFDRHLLHWLLERSDTRGLLVQFADLEHLIQSLRAAEELLPPDTGAARPMDDHRFIRYLADQFEACGKKARAYLSSHSDEGYAKTPFRQFVHRFYRLLPLKTRRTQRGLDEAIRQALAERRRAKRV
jgi:hypothetical protein